MELDMLLTIYCYLCSVNLWKAGAQAGVKPARADAPPRQRQTNRYRDQKVKRL